MESIFEKAGFTHIDNNYKDLELFKRENVLLASMKKFRDNKKAFRQASNHLDEGLIGEISDVLDNYQNDRSINSLVLSSSHKVAFSRGAKIEVLIGATTDQCRRFIQGGQDLLIKIEKHSKPVIAAITGLTLGGGLEMSLACDYRIASTRENVIFGLPEASLGILPGMGGTQNLPRIIDKQKAHEIILNARTDITTEDALRLRLLDDAFDPDVLIEKVFNFAKNENLKKRNRISQDKTTVTIEQIQEEIKEYLKDKKITVSPDDNAAPVSKLLIKFVFDKTDPDKYLDGLMYEREVLCYLQKTEDCSEGLQALIDERKPLFKGK